ncbi:MAG TPA: aldehyde dehydrogenase [Methylomirabilota bacterium]|jgi:acyl-CoA reductase-like NAD-dependent aldehyde dehydrogenase|nr:aldehyde dehydrogenase [Methylomirabilota bacterium]
MQPTFRSQLFIYGEYVHSASGKTFPVVNPANNEVLTELAEAGVEDVNRAVAAARKAFDEGPWPRLKTAERARMLRHFAELLVKHAPELEQIESLDVGKPVKESGGHDIPRAANNFSFFADALSQWTQDAHWSESTSLGVDVNLLSVTMRQPLGVAGIIIPWNSPMMLGTWKLAPCLATGCTAVLKPSEWAPLSLMKLGEIAQEAGLPPGVLNVIAGFGDVGAAVVSHPDVNAVSFTGGVPTGKRVMKAAADTLKRISLELGGKSPNIIFADADLDLAVKGAVRAIFRSQGQSCVAGSRLLLQDAIYDRFMERFLSAVANLKVGDPLDPTTDFGPLITAQHRERVEGFIEAGLSEGARLLIGGKRPTDPALQKGNYLLPTVFEGVTSSMRICQEEIFGPVLAVQRFHDEAEAIRLANSTIYGLAGFLWTQDVNRALRVSSAVKTGMMWVNSFFLRDLRTPFGGARESGVGREGGRYSLEFYTEPKFVCIPY